MSVVNWGEVYYTTMRRVSQAAAEPEARKSRFPVGGSALVLA